MRISLALASLTVSAVLTEPVPLHDMKLDHSKAESCLYFRWTENGLTLWISWVDNCTSVGKKELVLNAKKGMTDWLNCNEVGELTEFVG